MKKKERKKERFAARASGNVLASDGTRINEGRRRFLIIKRNQYHRTGFTHQLPKTKENRKETPHHLIQLIRANFLRYEGRCHQRHQQKSHCFVEKPNKTPRGTAKVTIRFIISRRRKANTFFCANLSPKCNPIFHIVNSHFLITLDDKQAECAPKGNAATDTANLPITCACACQKRRGEERTRGTAPEAKQKLFTITWTQKTNKKKNANMRMHTNEQPRQSGDKQELINASHLFCLPMGSLIHLLGELFFFFLQQNSTK